MPLSTNRGDATSIALYAAGCRAGIEHAARFCAWLQRNPALAGGSALCAEVASLDHGEGSAARGYRVGFFSAIDKLLVRGLLLTDLQAHFADEWKAVEPAYRGIERMQRRHKPAARRATKTRTAATAE